MLWKMKIGEIELCRLQEIDFLRWNVIILYDVSFSCHAIPLIIGRLWPAVMLYSRWEHSTRDLATSSV